jgi:hypothetical protein
VFADDDGLGLRVALLVGVVLPREFERGDVAAIDLRERGVPRLAIVATVGRPVSVAGTRADGDTERGPQDGSAFHSDPSAL